jgi:hypothetical protein
LSFLKRTKTRINVIKIEAKVKLLGIELGKGREDKLRVKTGLFSNVKSYNI